MQKIETVLQQRIDQIFGSVEQQRDAFGMLGMNRKVERLLLFNPSDAQRQGTAFLFPGGMLQARSQGGADRAPCVVRVGKDGLDGIFHLALAPKIQAVRSPVATRPQRPEY